MLHFDLTCFYNQQRSVCGQQWFMVPNGGRQLLCNHLLIGFLQKLAEEDDSRLYFNRTVKKNAKLFCTLNNHIFKAVNSDEHHKNAHFARQVTR